VSEPRMFATQGRAVISVLSWRQANVSDSFSLRMRSICLSVCGFNFSGEQAPGKPLLPRPGF